MPRKKIKQISISNSIIDFDFNSNTNSNSDSDLNTNSNSNSNSNSSDLLEIKSIINEKDISSHILIQSNTELLKQKNELPHIEDDIIDISQLKGKEIWHYSMLEKFFSTCDLNQIQRMIDIINGNHLISLRFLDWFVTRYCFLYKTTINVTNQFCIQKNFNINISYKAQLKSFTKKYFDPFKRKKKFFFTLEKYKISFLTTLGQLNFFRWAITHDIINNTEINYRIIVSKYDYVNSFFKKHSSTNSTNSANSNNSTNSSNSSTSANSTTLINTGNITNTSNDSSINSNSDSELNSIINNIYNSTNNSIIMIENQEKKKSTFKIPRVSRNIYLEL